MIFVWNLRRIQGFQVSNVTYSTLRGVQPAIVKSKTNASHYLNLKNQKCRSFNWQGLRKLWDISFSWFPISILGGEISLIKNLNLNGKYVHNKEVCLITHHFKYHPSVTRTGLVQSLTKTIQDIPGTNTKLVYVVGLPGTGKKELTRQYAESHFKKLSGNKTSGIFVAMINASNPEIFHQDLLKLSEKIGIADYSTKAERTDGYHKILCKIASHLEQTTNWLLVLNDIKLDANLKWLIGERHIKQQKVKNIDLSNSLPSPSDPSNGTILITTCDSFAYGHRAANTASLNMPNGMEDDEALQLLQFGSDIGGLDQCKSATNVVHTLGNVPTSVYCAGLTVQNKANNPVSTPEEAEALFDSLHKDILSKSFSNILSMASKERIDKLKYPQKMQNMQKLAVQDVAKSDKSRKKAFTLLACCAPAAVPPKFVYSVVGKWINKRELFIDHLIYGREEPETNMSGKTRNFLSWLTNLFGSSESSNSELINYEVIKVSEGYHDIFQEVFLTDIKKVLHSKLFKKSVESLIDYYNENNRKDDIDTITTRKLLLPHVQSFLNLIENGKDINTFQIYEPYLADLYYCLGSAYILEGDLARPLNCFNKSLMLYEKEGNKLGKIKVYIQLGKAYRDISEQYKSIEALEKALDSHPNKSNYELLVHRYKLFRYKGDASASIGNYEESSKYFAQCLEVIQEMDETSETKHFSLLIYLKLVSIYRKSGNIELYRYYMKKSEDILSDLYQEDMPLLEAELGLQRAVLLRNSCLPKESICILKGVLATFKDIYGKKHIKVALIESELSISLRRNGNLKESEEMALAALKKLQEKDLHHYERTKVLKNLGSTYTYLGKFSDAEKCFDQALEIANKQFDINRQAWVIKKSEILEQMGKMKRKKGEIIASLELLKQCVDLKSKLYFSSNPYHPDFAEALVSLGKTQHRVGLLAESFESLHHAENIRVKYYGEYYPQTIFVKGYHARVLRDAGDHEKSFKKIDEAILQYEEQIESARDMKYLQERPEYISMYATKGLLQMDAMLKTTGKDNTDSQYYGLNEARKTLIKALTVQENHGYKSLLQEVELECILGRVYCLLKEYKNAMELFKKAYKTISKIEKNHPLSASVQANWSRVHYESNDLQNAIDLLENAWKIRNNYTHSELHPNSLVYSYYLAEYYKEIGNIEKAAKWYSSAINGYSYLISKEDIRVSHLKQPHVILQWKKLPVYDTWYELLKKCRRKYEEVLSSF